jgi:hypothetical protein
VQSTVGNKNSLMPMSNEYSVNDIRCLVMYALNKVDTQKDFCENFRVFSGLYVAIMAFKIYEPNKQFELEKGPLLYEQNHSSFYNSKGSKSRRKINRSNQFYE